MVSYSLPVIDASQGISHKGFVLNAPSSLLVDFWLAYPNRRSIMLDYAVDFAVHGMSDNLEAVGRYLDRVQAAGILRAWPTS